MKRTCDVKGCDRDCYAKELCKRHYERLRIGGDPHTPSRKELTLEERFRAKFGPKDPVTGCIEWTARRNNDGYGQIYRAGKQIGAHCLAWELKHGPIPEGKCVCHHCDNPACCNDVHLYLGTPADNAADRDAKGRGARLKGERNGQSKLTEADVIEIHRRLADGETQRVISEAFGISREAISAIKLGKTWSHLK
jgi:hypothetical protein